MADMAHPFENFMNNFDKGIEDVMNQAGEEICQLMRDKLISDKHVDTGALRDSIRSETVNDGNGKIITYIYADAENEENHAQYAEFIEEGTGAAHGRAGGRTGTWRYKDRNGNWHTTDGMDADPFIEPAVEQVVSELDDLIDNVMYDIDKYGK